MAIAMAITIAMATTNNSGVDTEASYPYVGKQGKMCLFKKEDVGATDTSFVRIPSK